MHENACLPTSCQARRALAAILAALVAAVLASVKRIQSCTECTRLGTTDKILTNTVIIPHKPVSVAITYGIYYVCMVIHMARVWTNRVRLPILLVVS